jgi:hypothetical protein
MRKLALKSQCNFSYTCKKCFSPEYLTLQISVRIYLLDKNQEEGRAGFELYSRQASGPLNHAAPFLQELSLDPFQRFADDISA